jgi:hypothetical protein
LRARLRRLDERVLGPPPPVRYVQLSRRRENTLRLLALVGIALAVATDAVIRSPVGVAAAVVVGTGFTGPYFDNRVRRWWVAGRRKPRPRG